MNKQRSLGAIDLCGGAGGWACAARGLPIQMLAAVDMWPPACRTYEINHPGTQIICGDLREAELQKTLIEKFAGRVDLIVGGVPCEWLTRYRSLRQVNAVERASERATLDSVLALVKALAPRYWCLEDVEGLIAELPILTPYVKINSAAYSPQRRKRVYVGQFPSPSPGRSKRTLRHAIRPGPYRIGSMSFQRTPVISRTFNRGTVLAAHLDRKAPTVCDYGSRRDGELVLVDPSLPGGKRQLEWQEGAALQGFPSHYLFYGCPGDVSRMVARAIQIDTGRAILKAIVRDWRKQT